MKSLTRRIAYGVAVAVILLVLPTCFFTVQETEIGLVTRFGRPVQEEAKPGLHVKLPWPIEKVLSVDQRLLVFDNEPTEMLTRDKRNVVVDSFLLWRISDPLRYVQTVGHRLEAEARLLDLATSELGAAIGSVPMESLINPDPAKVELRQVGSAAAAAIRTTAVESYGIDVVDLRINGFNMPRQNRASVIERMRAERERIAAGFRSEGEEQALEIEAEATKAKEILLAEARAQAEIIRGTGEAEALQTLAEAYRQNPAFYRLLRSLESLEEIVDDDTTVFLDANSELLEALRALN